MVNENGQKWEKGSYDEMIASYFEANELNIPFGLDARTDGKGLGWDSHHDEEEGS